MTKLLDVKDLCRHLKCGKKQVLSLIHSGVIKAFRVGREWRVSETAFDQFVHDMEEARRE